MNGPIILNNTREQLADEIFTYREPKPAPQKTSPWLAMSGVKANWLNTPRQQRSCSLHLSAFGYDAVQPPSKMRGC
jgi:hypothetical protein